MKSKSILKRLIMVLKVRKFRSFNDFKWGSFTVYVTKNECIIRGILKKTDNFSPYMVIIDR